MKNKPSLAYQRKRPRYKSGSRPGIAPPAGGSHDSAGGSRDPEDTDTPTTMEARTQEAEAAYNFSGQESEESAAPPPPAPRGPRQSQAPASNSESAPADETKALATGDENSNGGPSAAPANADGSTAAQLDPAAQRREQERMRRDQERDRRENERKERERRENERRDQQKKEQERRERERIMELRNLDVDSICSKAWEIYSAEVKEEGVELFPDNDARELCKRSFRLAELFLLEESRLRKLRSEPLPPESAPSAEPVTSDSSPAAPANEPTMGE